jgi:hypothetical protein
VFLTGTFKSLDSANRPHPHNIVTMSATNSDASWTERLPTEDPGAGAPFDDPSDGDLIIRSSDGVMFYVYKFILSLASPVFKDMLALGQQDNEAEKPTVDVFEDNETWKNLLRFIDPRATASDQLPLSLIKDMLYTSQKYQMVNVRSKFGYHLKHFITSKPVDVYICAAELSSEDSWARPIAIAAAQESLKLPFSSILSGLTQAGVDRASGVTIARLLQFHQLCGNRVRSLLSSTKWFDQWNSPMSYNCTECSKSISTRAVVSQKAQEISANAPHSWFDYLLVLGDLLSSHQILSDLESALPYESCMKIMIRKQLRLVLDFNTALEAQIRKFVEQVSNSEHLLAVVVNNAPQVDLGFESGRMPFTVKKKKTPFPSNVPLI